MSLKVFRFIALTGSCLMALTAVSQQSIQVSENLVTEGVPPISSEIVSQVKAYNESRSASLADWHPRRNEMIISTRFANSNQIHYVTMAGGDRKQITFFDEPVTSGVFEPVNGNYFLFGRDVGGNEFSQIYRYDFADKRVTLLTDGKRSQNGNMEWNTKGDLIAYGSTRRNGADRDFYVMNPLDPSSDKIVSENAGGGWAIYDWSPDDKQLLIGERLSINESRLYLLDITTGKKTRLLPQKDERTTYQGIAFSSDGKGIYVISTKDSEFNRLCYFDLTTSALTPITASIPWDVEDAVLSKDGKQIAFYTNENGTSRLYLMSASNRKFEQLTAVPTGVMGGLKWAADSKSLGFTLNTYNSSSDVYEYNTATRRLVRWTESELGLMDVSQLSAPELIKWKSFDGREISGYLYRASSKFQGKRPVMISIHGGPEGQSQPTFAGRSNYYLNELGISIIYPNVRGSSGYGKTFLDMDNGVKREESVKDIGALLDWIATQPSLDKDRVLVTGGSYGGYMTLAVSFRYPEKIRCSIDVVGISHFKTFMQNTEAYRRDLRRVEYGDERDPQIARFFETISPLNHAEKITKPIYIIQGGNDPRVPATEAIQMKDNIKQAGGTVWFLMAKDEGHGFRKKNNQDFQFYSTVEFMKRYLLN